MIEAGNLKITLTCDNEKVQQVDIKSTRPLHISRLFIGKSPTQTLKMLPLLFNVCGVAHSFAAFKAFGIAENSAETAAREMLLNVEIIREHCFWLLIHTDKTRLAPFLKQSGEFKKALFASGDAFSFNSVLQVNESKLKLNALIEQLEIDLNALFANQRDTFLTIKNETDLTTWLKNNDSILANLLHDLQVNHYQDLGRCELHLLPNLTDLDLLTNFNSQTPTWQNECCETSCLNRQQTQPLIADLLAKYGNGLMTRLASRLVELATMPNVLRQNVMEMQTPFNQTQNKTGVAQIQASRGLLIHKVKLKNDVIANYQIVAPTEWNFQNNAVAALSLQSLSARDKTLLHQQAALIINAIDPCVGFELVID